MRSKTKRIHWSELVSISVILVISFALFLILGRPVATGELVRFDSNCLSVSRELEDSGLIKIACFFSFFGTATFLIPFYIFILFHLIRTKQDKYAVFTIILVCISLVSGWGLKAIFQRPRPTTPLIHEAGWYSFPSGHALGAYTCCAICLLLIWRASFLIYEKFFISVFIFCAGCLVGLSRIYLQVHFATDILGSLCFAVFLTSLLYLIFKLVIGKEFNQKAQLRRTFNRTSEDLRSE